MNMRAPILGLAIASAAFAGSSLYFWAQLQDERAHAAQVAETTLKLDARIAELEQARAEFVSRRMARNGMVVGSFGSSGTVGPAPTAMTGTAVEPSKDAPRPVFITQRAPPSAAMQKMMRSQVRAMTRRQYADVGVALGLDKDMAARLIDLIVEQQSAQIQVANDSGSYVDVGADYAQRQREHEQAIADLLGADKMQALKDYQESIPARMETEMLARQLEDNGAPLDETQQKKLVAVVVEERNRVPMPEFTQGMDPAQYNKLANEWRDDYEKRVADQAAHFLNPDQVSAYNDITQWHKDIREQSVGTAFVNVDGAARAHPAASEVTLSYGTAVPMVVTSGATTSQEPGKK